MVAKRAKTTSATATPPHPANDRQAYLITGGDDYLLDTVAREQINRLLPTAEQEFGLETFDAEAETVAEAAAVLRRLLEALRMPTMFAARRLVWARNASFLSDKTISRGKDVVPLVTELAAIISAGLPPEQHLIITAAEAPAKSPLTDAFAKHGAVLQQETPKPWRRQEASLAHATRELRQVGLSADPATVATLVRRVGAETRQLHQEVIKLSVYMGDRKQVAPEDIAAVVSTTRDYFVWDLEDAVVQGNLREALIILRRLLFQREDPIRLVNTLETRFRYLLILQEAVQNGWINPKGGKTYGGGSLPPQLAGIFDGDRRMANPYTRNILAQQAADFSHDALLKALRQILTVRQQLVSSRTPPALLMEMLLIRLCRVAARSNV
ncbi:MAG: DNA polymerase III subunit delta [Kiritimatiellia bacterium]